MDILLKDELKKRLVKIEGQTRGIQKMIENDRSCLEILTQTKSILSALNKVDEIMLKQHLKQCVAESFTGDFKNEKIDEVILTWFKN